MLRRGFFSRTERGVVLVAALLILVILSAVVLEHAYSVRVESSLAGGARDRLRARLALRSAVTFAGEMLALDMDPRFTALNEPWARPMAPMVLPDGTTVTFRVSDEAARYNIAFFDSDGKLSSIAAKDGFERLLAALDLPRSIADKYVDWVDQDEKPFPEGAEREYEFLPGDPFFAPNRPIRVSEELYYLYEVPHEEIERLLPVVTIYSEERRVNVNTAPREVLESLSANLAPHQVSRILGNRKNTPFHSLEDLRERVNLDENLAGELNSILTVNSDLFRIGLEAESNGVRAFAEAVVRRPQDKNKNEDAEQTLVYWREW